MASGFVTEVSGMLQLSAEDLNDINSMRATKGKYAVIIIMHNSHTFFNAQGKRSFRVNY